MQTNKLGNHSVIANFSATFGQNGCAGIYPAMLAVMIAPTVVDPFSLNYNILTLILVVAISSFGITGVAPHFKKWAINSPVFSTQ